MNVLILCHRDVREGVWLPLVHVSMSQQDCPAQVSTGNSDPFWDSTLERLCVSTLQLFPNMTSLEITCNVHASFYWTLHSAGTLTRKEEVKCVWKKTKQNNNFELDSILQKCKALPFPLISLKMLFMDFQQKLILNRILFNCWFCFMSPGWWRTITTTLSEHYKTLYQMNNFRDFV